MPVSRVDLGPVSVRVHVGGSGHPVVLLHGHPRTHTTWHAVAPLRRLGHERFAVVGHDRGSYVAFRTAMDHPDLVSHLVVMDGLPLIEHLERTDATFAAAWWHWWFLAQSDVPAEPIIAAHPDWYRLPPPSDMGADNHADAAAALRDPAVVHGMCEDYRAGLGVDRDHDAADHAAGRRVQCPTLLLQSSGDDLDIHGDPPEIWPAWVDEHFERVMIDSGHHQAEQAPTAVAGAISRFLDRHPDRFAGR